MRTIDEYARDLQCADAWTRRAAFDELWLLFREEVAVDATPLIPLLSQTAREPGDVDPEAWRKSIDALGHLAARGAPTIEVLLEQLASPERRGWRRWVVEALGVAARRETREPLLTMLRAEDPWDRSCGADVLGRMGVIGRECAGALADLLDDNDANVRVEAVTALVRLEAWSETPRALRLADDPEPRVRRQVVDLLSRATPLVPGQAAALFARLDDTNKDVAFRALLGIAHLGPSAAPVLDRIIRELDGEHPRAASRVLGRLGPMAAAAAPRVAALLAEDGEYGPSQEDWDDLSRLGPAATAHLVPRLRDRHRQVRARVARALGVHGPDAAALAAVRAALQVERHLEVRHALELTEKVLTGLLDPAGPHEGPPRAEPPAPAEGAGPPVERLRHRVRPEGAKTFRVRVDARSPLNEHLVDWAGLEARLREPDRDHDVEWFDHLDPAVAAADVYQARALVRARLAELPLEALEQVVGEPLFLGDLLATADYAPPDWIIGARETTTGEVVLRAIEHAGAPPSYLRYPDVVPSLSFWGDTYHAPFSVPVEHHHALERLEGDTLALDGQRVRLTAEQVAALRDPGGRQRLYVRPEGVGGGGGGYGAPPEPSDGGAELRDPARVDRSPPLG